MLSYAFQILREQNYKNIETESFENVADLCAEILIKGVSSQIKRGLVKDYTSQADSLSCLRGKIDISASLKDQSFLRRQLVCNYDNFSVNSYINRIIKTTIDILVKSDISIDRKNQLQKIRFYFKDVQSLSANNINWRLNFNRNNQTYQMLVYICYLVLNGLLQTNSDGSTKLMDFLDDQRMSRLYEKFILEYYRKETPELRASSSQIPWDIDDGFTDLLPIMQSDVMLRKDNKTLIIDAKYYSRTTQRYFNSTSLHSANLYQIYSYVKNFDKGNTGNVSGMLLYAKTDEEIKLNHKYTMGGNIIYVQSLDLNCDFTDIEKQLKEIANSF